MTSELHGRRLSSPVRFTLACELGGPLDGAWWPHTASLARELPDLIDALRERVGQVVDIGVNWSPLDGVADLDLLNRRGIAAVPGRSNRDLRVMTVTGSYARVHLLVVPCQTSTAMAVMVLRQAADLPVLDAHQQTPAFHTASAIVQTARTQCAPRAAPADSSS